MPFVYADSAKEPHGAKIAIDWRSASHPLAVDRSRRHDPDYVREWHRTFSAVYLAERGIAKPRRKFVKSFAESLLAAEVAAGRSVAEVERLSQALEQGEDLVPSPDFDPLAEAQRDFLRAFGRRNARARIARREHLARLGCNAPDQPLPSLSHPILMAFVQRLPKSFEIGFGEDKEVQYTGHAKLVALSSRYVEANKLYRGLLRVDIDRTFPSVGALVESLDRVHGLPRPNIASWFPSEDGSVQHPHLIWLLDLPVWFGAGSRTKAQETWRECLAGLTRMLLPLGADPGGNANPMRVKNPLCPEAAYAVLEPLPWGLAHLRQGLPNLPPGTLQPAPSQGSNSPFFAIAVEANRLAERLRRENTPESEALRTLADTILSRWLERETKRLEHRKFRTIKRRSARMAEYAWARAIRRVREALSPAEAASRAVLSRSRGGLARAARYRRDLAEALPLAFAKLKDSGKTRATIEDVARLLEVSRNTIVSNLDLFRKEALAAGLEPRITPGAKAMFVQRRNARRRTAERAQALARGEADPAPPLPDRRRRRRSRYDRPPRNRRRRLPIGLFRPGNPAVDQFIALREDLLIRTGGHVGRLSGTKTGTFYLTLHRTITEATGEAWPSPPKHTLAYWHWCRRLQRGVTQEDIVAFAPFPMDPRLLTRAFRLRQRLRISPQPD